jgi:hypothetical protein
MKEETPLHVAMRSGCSDRTEECLHQLLALGSLVDEKDKDVGTAYLSRWFFFFIVFKSNHFLINDNDYIIKILS